MLEKLNSADKLDAYTETTGFLKDSWGIDFEAKTYIKPWTIVSDQTSNSTNTTSQTTSSSSNSSSNSSTGSSNSASSTANSSTDENTNTVTISDGQTALAGPVNNTNNNQTRTNNSKQKDTEADEADVESDDSEVTADSEETAEIDEADTQTINDEEVAEGIDENITSESNSLNPLIIGIVIAAAAVILALAGFQVFNLRKRK